MQPSTPLAFDALLHELSTRPPLEARIAAFAFVRDLAYGDIGSRDPFDVLNAKRGTCSGKHALLKLIFERMGYRVRSFFALHDFREFPIDPWPEELRTFRSKTLTDYHDFLKIEIGGAWIIVDAIFDRSMQQWGFPVGEWDGVSSMELPVLAQEAFPAEGNVEEHKKSLIAALPEDVQRARKEFLAALTQWLDGRRLDRREQNQKNSSD